LKIRAKYNMLRRKMFSVSKITKQVLACPP
jgi:hypothetical protein